MGALTMGLQDGIQASDVFPEESKMSLMTAVERGVSLVSDEEIKAGLESAGADAAFEEELLDIYDLARTQAFKAGVSLLTFFSLIAIVLSFRLPKRKLVGA
jgi:hypothetical protein